jgi:hypothetical protein
MNDYSYTNQIATLQSKGGLMLFSVEKEDRFFRGMVFLSPVDATGQRKRIVCMKVYRYKEV